MSTPPIYQTLSDSKLQEWLKYSKKLLATVDETIELIPYNPRASTKQTALMFLFMDARSAAYDICVLAESLLTNRRHHFSRAIEASTRLLLESAIDYFYISESDDSVAERRMDFLDVVNTENKSDHKKKDKAFKKKYKDTKRGDFWSGTSREEKIKQGIEKYPPISRDTSFASLVKSTIAYLNERVHGNTIVASYFSFNKHTECIDEHHTQVALGLLILSSLFYSLSCVYSELTGRRSEIKRFEFYNSYIHNLLREDPAQTHPAKQPERYS